jgi:TctA family transporter
MAVALLVPVTFFLPPVPAVACMVTATAMAIFAGDVPGALLRIPGTPASAAYTDESYALTRQGHAETVLGADLVSRASSMTTRKRLMPPDAPRPLPVIKKAPNRTSPSRMPAL